MEYLVRDQELELRYQAGKGAWTYHLLLPNTSQIKGRWGFLKVSGTIDGYFINSKNLFTISGQDKMLTVNAEIRKAIKKSGGDLVRVTLYLDHSTENIDKSEILYSFQDAGVLSVFEKLGVKKTGRNFRFHFVSP